MNERSGPLRSVGAVLAVGLVVTATGCSQKISQMPLTRTLEAHGGLEQWRRQRTLTYTLIDFPLTPQVAKPNTATVDLHNRYNRIEGVGFTVAFDGNQTWSVPGPDAVGLPPRLFALGSFYFVGMPFVFADPGTIIEGEGTGVFRGKTYRVVRVRYDTGVGYSAEDDYVAFIDHDTDRLALIHHSVTESPDIERVTWVFDEWQRVRGLYVPAQMTFYSGWNPDDPGQGASCTVQNVSFSTRPPDPSIYSPPLGAFIDPASTLLSVPE